MLVVHDLTMGFGGKSLFNGVSLQFHQGNRYGLVGPNGAGKSTFLKILSGELAPDRGEVVFPSDTSVGTLKQDQFCREEETLVRTVLQGRPRLWEALQRKEALLQHHEEGGKWVESVSQCEEIIHAEGGYAAESEASALLEGLGLRTDQLHGPMKALSGGYRLRVLLAQVLFGRPEVLLLDEPTNHLDLYSIEWLTKYLCQYPGVLVVTSHHRDFLNGVCTSIADVDYGTIRLYKGNYDQFLLLKQEDRERKESMLERHQKRKDDLQGFVDRFRAKASKARQAQSKARIVEKLEEEMEGLDLTPSSRRYPHLAFRQARPSGALVLKVEGLCKAYGDHQVLKDVSLEVNKGEKVAVVGPNGIGKSTFLQVIMGKLASNEGSFKWGHGVRSVYFPQNHLEEVKGTRSVLDWLRSQDPSVPEQEVRRLLGCALFTGDTGAQSVSTLSGGEVARLILAKMMLLQGNVLVFDEPTNHLDMEAIENLVEAIQTFPGTVLMVSHNTHFLSHTATKVIELQHDGVHHYLGGFQDFHRKRMEVAQGNLGQEQAKSTKGKEAYLDRKQQQSQKRKWEREVAQLEERFQKMEKELHELHEQMAAPGFYTQGDSSQRLLVLERKSSLESELETTLGLWEEAQEKLDAP